MQLQYVKTTRCPECECHTVVEERIRTSNNKIDRHTNTQQWELRTFLCGYSVEWVPNHKCEVRKGACANIKDPNQQPCIDLLNKQQETVQAQLRVIRRGPADAAYATTVAELLKGDTK